MRIIDFGVSFYRTVWEKQKQLQDLIITNKNNGIKETDEYLMIGEHYPVYTLGFHGNYSNMLLNEDQLSQRGCELVKIERGGDITYHGPGQLIIYPIIDLERYRLGVKRYVWILEEAVITLLEEYHIKGERIEGATGVWIGKGTNNERKICAIGVKISRYVTMHGLALNINTDLEAFSAINPCGFIDKGVTSMKKEKGIEINMSIVKRRIADILVNLFKERERRQS